MTKATEVIDDLQRAADDGDAVSVDAVNDALGHRSTGAFLALPAALEITPLGGIPGVPTTLAVIIAIFAVQIALGRSDMWLPGLIGARSVKAERLDEAASKMRPVAEWSDRHLGAHLTALVGHGADRLAAVAVLILCATVPPLEVVPFASSIPMGTIVLFGTALLVRDGRVMALAWVAFLAALAGVWFLWP